VQVPELGEVLDVPTATEAEALTLIVLRFVPLGIVSVYVVSAVVAVNVTNPQPVPATVAPM